MTSAETINLAFKGELGGFELDAAFDVPAHGVTALFGPSGCGKTSLLRCIAGLQRLPGTCVVAGEVWQDQSVFLPPHRRAVGYVFQEASLFAHLSVRGNLLYASRGNILPPANGRIGFGEVVDLLGLAPLLERAPDRLSGGERQRVAVGRALLSQPRLLMMDEPLSALDRETRNEILPFLDRLHHTLAIPVLYVTHDMSEVERLADHLVLLRAGKVVASGPLETLQSDMDLPLARERDAAVAIEGKVSGFDERYGLVEIDVAGGRFVVPGGDGSEIGDAIRLRVGAGDVSIAREAPRASSILNILPARIVAARPLDDRQIVLVLGLGGHGGARLLARLTRRSWEALELAEDMDVFAQIKSVALDPS